MNKSPEEHPADALLRTYKANRGINHLEGAATLRSRPALDAAPRPNESLTR
jgi:hypothetical protein